MLVVYQDGREFYSTDRSVTNPIFTASAKVRDFDLLAAHEARQSFEKHMRDCQDQDWRYETAQDRADAYARLA